MNTARPITAALIAALIAPAACSPAPQPAPPTNDCLSTHGDLALAVSGRRHSPAPRLDGELRQLVTDVVNDNRTVFLINVDGNPALQAKFAYPDLPTNSSRREAVDTAVSDIAAAAAAVRADDPEVNDIAALTLGADLVRPTHGTVVLYDNGASTTAPLDESQPGVLGADPDDIAHFITNTHQSPDWRDTSIGLAAIGAVTAPQPPIPPAGITNLKNTYLLLAHTFGARCATILSAPVSATPVPSDQPVTLIPIPNQPTFHAAAQQTPAPITYDNTTIHFQPNSAELTDPQTARAALQPVIDYLTAHPDTTATITGTCATGTGEGPDPITLSTDRATTIENLLTTHGVAPTQLATHGVGTNFPEFIPDTDRNGQLQPGAAAQNRTVRITFAHT